MKNEKRDCYCALCRSPRVLRYERNLSTRHYLQITLLTAVFTWGLYPWLEWKTLGSFFILWAGFELSRKLLYRNDVKCQVCGFDPTWYRRDVRIARKRVETFLQENPDSPLLRTRKNSAPDITQ
jgi:hypothetical protein